MVESENKQNPEQILTDLVSELEESGKGAIEQCKMDQDSEHLTKWGTFAISRILAAMPNRKAKFSAMRATLDDLYRPDETM